MPETLAERFPRGMVCARVDGINALIYVPPGRGRISRVRLCVGGVERWAEEQPAAGVRLVPLMETGMAVHGWIEWRNGSVSAMPAMRGIGEPTMRARIMHGAGGYPAGAVLVGRNDRGEPSAWRMPPVSGDVVEVELRGWATPSSLVEKECWRVEGKGFEAINVRAADFTWVADDDPQLAEGPRFSQGMLYGACGIIAEKNPEPSAAAA